RTDSAEPRACRAGGLGILLERQPLAVRRSRHAGLDSAERRDLQQPNRGRVEIVVTGNLTLTAAFLLGLFASGHCILMCGGISGALMLAADGSGRRHPPAGLLLAMQIGRVSSYMLAAAMLAGIGASVVHFVDQDGVRIALRVVSAA